MNRRFFDVHSHLQFSQFDVDRHAVLSRMREEAVAALVVGVDYHSSTEALSLAEKHDFLFAAIGLHPNDSSREMFSGSEFEKLVSHPKVVAIGECGLDYFRTEPGNTEKNRQKEVFERELEFAVSHAKPLMIHCRAAHDDMISILLSKKREYGDKLRGTIHFFTAGLDIAKQYFNLDFTISFSGVITFTHDYDEVVRWSPLSMILSETDCPYASPVPHRGARNEPAYVLFVVQHIALLRALAVEAVQEALVENAKRLFKLSK